MNRGLERSANFAIPLLGIAVMLLAVAAPAAAATPPDPACAPGFALLGLPSLQQLAAGAVATAKKDPIGDPGVQTYCVAQCYDGTHVTCTGTSCWALDAACSVDPSQHGYCYGSSSGTINCPDCPTSNCTDPTPCTTKNGTSCSGHGASDCSFPNGSCGSCLCNSGTWTCTI